MYLLSNIVLSGSLNILGKIYLIPCMSIQQHQRKRVLVLEDLLPFVLFPWDKPLLIKSILFCEIRTGCKRELDSVGPAATKAHPSWTQSILLSPHLFPIPPTHCPVPLLPTSLSPLVPAVCGLMISSTAYDRWKVRYEHMFHQHKASFRLCHKSTEMTTPTFPSTMVPIQIGKLAAVFSQKKKCIGRCSHWSSISCLVWPPR